MSMGWDARLKAAWRGEVSNADLSALFATTAGLASLQRALEDRRLSAELEHPEGEWRAVLAVGRFAAPLWLADALVALAGALYDAETTAHPDRPSYVTAYAHDLVAALLVPVEDIIAGVTAALADPSRPALLPAPLRVGPGGDIAAQPLPSPANLPSVRGLATGARRVHTSAAATLASLQTVLAKSPVPDWLTAGLRRLDGELQAAGARMDMAEVRLASLVGTRDGDPATLAALCRDLWTIAGVSVVAGQMLSDPHLMPEAAAAGAAGHETAPVSPRSAPPPRVAAARPAPPVPAPRRVELPRIDPGAAPLHQREEVPPPPARPSAPPAASPLPIIGEPSPPPAQPNKPLPDVRRPESAAPDPDAGPAVKFPDIG